jgi:hypothetical protein
MRFITAPRSGNFHGRDDVETAQEFLFQQVAAHMQEGSAVYRHKAAECARKALASREPAVRNGYAEAARRWRNLAEKKEGGKVAERNPPTAELILFPR